MFPEGLWNETAAELGAAPTRAPRAVATTASVRIGATLTRLDSYVA